MCLADGAPPLLCALAESLRSAHTHTLIRGEACEQSQCVSLAREWEDARGCLLKCSRKPALRFRSADASGEVMTSPPSYR